MGSYNPLFLSSRDADGSMPMEPVSIEASSDKISPNIFPVTITSNCFGSNTSCIAALSTNICESSTSRYSWETSITTSRHSCEHSSTFILSTEQSFLLRLRATRKATWAILYISASL